MFSVDKVENTSRDKGFIFWILKNYLNVLDDFSVRDKDYTSMIEYFLNDRTARIIRVDGNEIGLFYLSSVIDGLSCVMHGYLNTRSLDGREIGAKNFYLLKKNRIFDTIIKEVFETFNVKAIDVFYPEWLYHKKEIGSKKVKSAFARLIGDKGFKTLCLKKYKCFKDGKEASVFELQICKGFFFKWREIEKLYAKGMSIKNLSEAYNVDVDMIKKVARINRWLKKD